MESKLLRKWVEPWLSASRQLGLGEQRAELEDLDTSSSARKLDEDESDWMEAVDQVFEELVATAPI